MGQEGTSSYGRVVGHIAQDFLRLVKQEAELVRAEARSVIPRVRRQLLIIAAAGFVMAVSVLPLVAFLVIGLGRLLGDNYWLSSLLIGLLGLSGAGAVAYHSLRQMREDVDLPESRRALRDSAAAIRGQVRGFRQEPEERSVV